MGSDVLFKQMKSVLDALFEADLMFMTFSGVNEVAAGGARRLQPNRVVC
jgi:hypothetical protein